LNIEEIRQHVTHFSEELKFNVIQEQEIIVGGRVLSVVPPIDDKYPMYIVMLDDNVGVNHVYVLDTMFNAYKDFFVEGSYIFVEGLANVVSRSRNREIKKEVSVFAYAMKDITREEIS
jgi:hypothetical protein